MPRRAARAHEVGGDHRLAVPRGQRVDGAPGEGRQQEQEQDALARGRVAEHLGQALVGRAVAGLAELRPVRRLDGARAGLHAEARASQVRRALEQVLGVGAAGRSVGSLGRRARAHRRALARLDHDRLPADAAGERAVAQLDLLRRVDLRRQRDLDSRRLQPALALGMGDRRRGSRSQSDTSAVDGQRQPPLDLGLLAPQQLGVGERALLERRDLGLVEDVPHVDAVRRHRHLAEVVDGEVAERVGARRGREQGERDHGGHEDADHRSSSAARARFACRG